MRLIRTTLAAATLAVASLGVVSAWGGSAPQHTSIEAGDIQWRAVQPNQDGDQPAPAASASATPGDIQWNAPIDPAAPPTVAGDIQW